MEEAGGAPAASNNCVTRAESRGAARRRGRGRQRRCGFPGTSRRSRSSPHGDGGTPRCGSPRGAHLLPSARRAAPHLRAPTPLLEGREGSRLPAAGTASGQLGAAEFLKRYIQSPAVSPRPGWLLFCKVFCPSAKNKAVRSIPGTGAEGAALPCTVRAAAGAARLPRAPNTAPEPVGLRGNHLLLHHTEYYEKKSEEKHVSNREELPSARSSCLLICTKTSLQLSALAGCWHSAHHAPLLQPYPSLADAESSAPSISQ